MWCRYCIAICIHARYRGCIKTLGSVADPAFSSGAVSLAAYVVPWVRFSCLVRSCDLLHNCNPRCGWLVRPYPTGTSTLQETPSFLAHNGLELCCPAARAWLLHSRTTQQARHYCISCRPPGQPQVLAFVQGFSELLGSARISILKSPSQDWIMTCVWLRIGSPTRSICWPGFPNARRLDLASWPGGATT